MLVAGGIGLALFMPAWRQGWHARCWFAAFGLATLVGFVLAHHIGTNQLNTPITVPHTAGQTISTQAGMEAYWGEGFPPASPLQFIKWIVLQATGQLTAYPVGSAKGGSILTAILCVVGAVCWARRGRWSWLALTVAPILLGLGAAIAHRYPFGPARLSQHLAPGICLLAGLGLASLIRDRLRRSARPMVWAATASGCFALIGIAGLAKDIVRPYRDKGCEWMRTTMMQMRHELSAGDRVLFCQPRDTIEIVFAWHWLNEGERVGWGDCQLSERSLSADRIWGFHDGPGGGAACEQMAQKLRRLDPSWQLVKRIPYAYQAPDPMMPLQECDLFCFVRSSKSSPVSLTSSSSHEDTDGVSDHRLPRGFFTSSDPVAGRR